MVKSAEDGGRCDDPGALNGPQESPPALRGRAPPLCHVFCHRRLGNLDPEVQQLPMNPGRAPQWILRAHPQNQLSGVRGNLREARDINQETGSKLEGRFTMNVPEWVKPAAWGVVGGAIAAIVVGFFLGGWVTGGTAIQMAATSAETAIVQAFTPLCVAKAEQQPEQLVLLKEKSSWQRDDFVVEAGWVANVTEEYRAEVASTCASAVLEAMEAEPTATPAN